MFHRRNLSKLQNEALNLERVSRNPYLVTGKNIAVTYFKFLRDRQEYSTQTLSYCMHETIPLKSIEFQNIQIHNIIK